jgi:hypothetical protein
VKYAFSAYHTHIINGIFQSNPLRINEHHPHVLGENDFNKYSICGKRARLKDAGQSARFIRLQIDARAENIKKTLFL